MFGSRRSAVDHSVSQLIGSLEPCVGRMAQGILWQSIGMNFIPCARRVLGRMTQGIPWQSIGISLKPSGTPKPCAGAHGFR